MAATDINRTTTITLPGEVSSEILQKTQESSAVMALARSIKLPGLGTTIPIITGDPEAAWVGETEKKPVKRGTLATKVMQPYTLAVIVPFSNQFRRDVPALYDELVKRLPLALAQKFDATVFGGVTAPGSNFDTLKACTAQEIGTDAYAGLVAADADIADHNGILNGWVLSPKGKALLLNAVDGNKPPAVHQQRGRGCRAHDPGLQDRAEQGRVCVFRRAGCRRLCRRLVPRRCMAPWRAYRSPLQTRLPWMTAAPPSTCSSRTCLPCVPRSRWASAAIPPCSTS